MPFIDRRRKAGQGWILTSNLRHAITSGKFSMADPVWSTVSSSCKSVLRGLFTIDPKQRLSASKLLEHPWLKQSEPTTTGMPTTGSSDNCCNHTNNDIKNSCVDNDNQIDNQIDNNKIWRGLSCIHINDNKENS